MLATGNLTQVEKLRMIETLWDELVHDKTTLTSPHWHENALEEAEQAQSVNKASFIDWESAKASLRDSKQ